MECREEVKAWRVRVNCQTDPRDGHGGGRAGCLLIVAASNPVYARRRHFLISQIDRGYRRAWSVSLTATGGTHRRPPARPNRIGLASGWAYGHRGDTPAAAPDPDRASSDRADPLTETASRLAPKVADSTKQRTIALTNGLFGVHRHEPLVPRQIRCRFQDGRPVSHDGFTVSRPGTRSSNPVPSSGESYKLRSPADGPVFAARENAHCR